MSIEFWENQFEKKCTELCSIADAAHDITHYYRVVRTAKKLAIEEKANFEVVMPAVWLHDFVYISKDDPRRAQASRVSAEAATAWLKEIGYPQNFLNEIVHAISAHSFSAQITPETIEAKVVQDADRLDGIGAIGIARCMMTGGTLNRRLYDPEEPFAVTRVQNDLLNTLDHFYVKLFKTAETMQTNSGKLEAKRRAQIMTQYLDDLRIEVQGK